MPTTLSAARPRPVHAFLGLCFAALLLCSSSQQQKSNEISKGFWISDDMFWKDGEPFRILGGEIHYFRIHPKYWEDRFLRAKALGLNTIQTYVPWNLHEPRQGEFHFEGFADLESFLKLAQDMDLLVMIRVGPYICGEWDFGGFPAWLLSQPTPLQLRSSDPAYLELVDGWWKVLLPKISQLLYENGGPVIMVQVENEFGSYGKDIGYLRHLVNQARLHLGKNVIIYTTDGGSKGNLENGTLHGDEVYTAVDFPVDWDAKQVFALQKTFNAIGKSPAMITEFYTGWLTHWTENIITTSSTQAASALEKILSLNASAVLYMAHGGTNFGFFSGANTGENSSAYKADITSYDYDAPISEAGDVDHPKFTALQKVLAKHNKLSLPSPPSLPSRVAYGKLHLVKFAAFFDVLQSISVPSSGIAMREPCTMESLNQISGFVLYETTLPAYFKSSSSLSIPKLHDRAQVFITAKDDVKNAQPCHIGNFERWSSHNLSFLPYAASPGTVLQILVENMGRLNYGPFLFDPKGILSSVLLDGIPLEEWRVFSIPLDNLSVLKSMESKDSEQDSLLANSVAKESFKSCLESTCNSEISSMDIGFYSGVLHINESPEPADSFISLKGWSKGLAFVNGFNLGRYWTTVGPQCTLYIPGPLLHQGENELLIFELEVPHPELSVELVMKPDFTCGSLQNT